MNLAIDGAAGAFGIVLQTSYLGLLGHRKQQEVNITDRDRLGVLLPDTGLREPDVSNSSADDQEDKS